MTTVSDTVDVPPGLKGVVVAETELGDVRGERGLLPLPPVLRRRAGRDAHARGRLVPAVRGPAARRRRARPRSPPRSRRCATLPGRGRDAAPGDRRGAGGGPLDGLRTALSLLGARARPAPRSSTSTPTQRAARRAAPGAVVPTILAALHRLRPGPRAVEPRRRPRPRGELPVRCSPARSPTPEHARAVEQYLISTVDHGFNASTFTARVDRLDRRRRRRRASWPRSARSPARCTAARRAGPSTLLDAIGTPERTDAVGPATRSSAATGSWASATRVYRTEDPRSVHAARRRPSGWAASWSTLAVAGRAPSRRDARRAASPAAQLHTNVEFYAGVVMDAVRPAPRDVHADVRRRAG